MSKKNKAIITALAWLLLNKRWQFILIHCSVKPQVTEIWKKILLKSILLAVCWGAPTTLQSCQIKQPLKQRLWKL